MGKRIPQLYVDDEMIQIAKQRHINMSALFRGMLNTEFKLTKGNEVDKLKIMNAKLSSALEQANIKLSKQEKEAKDEQERRGRNSRTGRIIHI